MAISFYIDGYIKGTNKVGIHSVGAYSGKPGGGALIIDADKVDEYTSKIRSIERKNKVLDWVMLVGS
ncbi:MAG: hypothetical protein NC191_05900, partial [Muribaculaceae bacterium]|nr:hypothetical protein [Muribaculaceae bacterium]